MSFSGAHCRQRVARDRSGNARVSRPYSSDWRDNPTPKMATLKKPDCGAGHVYLATRRRSPRNAAI
ncbi:hypothetical protein Rmet_6620 (plasmid) [Cupriavidus metallidurans CH34]|uniref:Uncharacterized protein n=1 Tax=Cupriavidus metallidurans (strain ATCC 43123 / DSM 2839 / NBRC 102507 / CH34) TaxID=266264 RepID=D3DY49_CUPMC|nr:hypothetical protein Rmet_6620 [Cupriavidus metallidurans CH34]